MPIQVKSEVGQLRKVLLHRPGKELEHLVPESLSRLLFDDIPFLEIAQQEHDYFAQVLKEHGAEVLYLEDIVSEVLSANPQLKEPFVNEFIAEAGDVAKVYTNELKEYLLSIKDNKEFVLQTMTGVNMKDLRCTQKSRLAKLLNQDSNFILDPIPNLYFTRDTFSSIGEGVSLNKMYSVTRSRESIYGRYIFNYHPKYTKTTQYYQPSNAYHIEGGDILNLTEKTILVGISERTSPEAIEQLTLNLFADEACLVENVIAIEIPRSRAFMHLDTVFTQIDYDKFTVHPHIMSTMRCFVLRKEGRDFKVEELETKIQNLLAKYLEVDRVKLIYCGGTDSIAAQREQWNDGSNTLAVAPGKVVVYDRNTVTNALLEDSGITCIKIKSSEISRGRGGPRCMSMPFLRESIY